jgi:hypothetical protein
MIINVLIFLGVINLIYLNIRLIIGVRSAFNTDMGLFWKWVNALETLATTVMLFILFKNYFNF